ncbi:MAG: hypothetical protein J0L97_09605, partial [Alphaproteobacteria bacterium]|nr:hypothetical protein [Alphaproteobacteria bacterium]
MRKVLLITGMVLFASVAPAFAAQDCDALLARTLEALDKHNRCTEAKDCQPIYFYKFYSCSPDPAHPPYVHAGSDQKVLTAL